MRTGYRKIMVLIVVGLCLVFSLSAQGVEETGGKKLDKVVLSSPFSPLAMPMAYIVENNLLSDYADSVELVIWNNPDQLRAQMSSGDVDFVSLPSNTASIFYNKGVKLKMLKISIWRVFYLVSEDESVTSIADLKGKQVFVPFRGDQPDLIFRTLCVQNGLDPEKDLEIQYVPSPQDIVMNLVGGKADYGLMIEPVATVASIKGKQNGKDLKRVVDLQQQWGECFGTEARFPNAGVAAMPGILKHPEVVEAFSSIYDEAVKWSVEHPEEAGELAAKYVDGVPAKIFAKSLNYTTFTSIDTSAVREEMERMYCEFASLDPASIGGELPDSDFYF